MSADPAAAGLRVGPGGSCRRRVGRVGWPGSSGQRCRPIQLARPPTLLRPGQPPAAALAATSTAGEGRPYRGYRGGGGGGGRPPWNPRSWAGFRAWRWWRSAAGWLPAPSDTIAARPASGGSCAGCDLNGGEKRTVQGLSWRRWRSAAGCGSLRHYCSPGQPPAAAALAATSTAGLLCPVRRLRENYHFILFVNPVQH